jgi:hypothetical protein
VGKPNADGNIEHIVDHGMGNGKLVSVQCNIKPQQGYHAPTYKLAFPIK